MRVCQFRHDGNLNCNAAAAKAAVSGRPTTPFYSQVRACQTNGSPQRHTDTAKMGGTKKTIKGFLPVFVVKSVSSAIPRLYVSFAVIEIFAFSTFDTGQPFSAASAYF
jgi:hypothetical protein